MCTGSCGCCPLPKATCCSDYTHCCPNGYTCDAAGTCNKGKESVAWVVKTESMPIVRKANVVCACNASQYCALSTCCQTASGLSLIRSVFFRSLIDTVYADPHGLPL